jgi:hypothetical protein
LAIFFATNLSSTCLAGGLPIIAGKDDINTLELFSKGCWINFRNSLQESFAPKHSQRTTFAVCIISCEISELNVWK